MQKRELKGKLINSENYEFIIEQDLHERGEDGELILVKKAVRCRYTCPISDIMSVEEAFNKSGRIHKNKCVVSLKERGETLVVDKYEDIQNIITNKNNNRFVGFKRYE